MPMVVRDSLHLQSTHRIGLISRRAPENLEAQCVLFQICRGAFGGLRRQARAADLVTEVWPSGLRHRS